MKERTRFIELYLTGLYTITELAERFGVSRQKLYKWLARHNVDGMKGLADHSRAPLHIPHRTGEEVAAKIIEFRRRFPFMGPRKIITRLTELDPKIDWPAPSTAGDILRRANLLQPRERRSPPAHRRPSRDSQGRQQTMASGRSTTGRYCWPASRSGR